MTNVYLKDRGIADSNFGMLVYEKMSGRGMVGIKLSDGLLILIK